MAPAVASTSPTLSHVILVQKPHSGDSIPDYTIWSFAMWGQLDYYTPLATFDYAFDGHGLAASTEYTLLYYPDPYPGDNLICIDHGTTNATGDILLYGSTNIGALPIPADLNSVVGTSTYPSTTGAKIWLVLSSDVDCISTPHHMTAWHPTLYLFELWLIQYDTAVIVPPVQVCRTRSFWNLSTHMLEHQTVCWTV
jgi:hypothetical protein